MKIRVYLKTPLYRSRGNSSETDLSDAVLVVCGKADPRDGGLEIEVNQLYNDKGGAVEAPFERIFLPLGKIDYYIIEQA